MQLLFNISFLEFGWADTLDILLVAIMIYQLYKLLKGTVAITIFLGFMSFYLFYLVVNATGMKLLGSILGQFIGVGVIAAIILFQQEIRRFLLLLGKTTVDNNKRVAKLLHLVKVEDEEDMGNRYEELVEAVFELSSQKEGALLVFSDSSDLREYTDTGDLIDAKVNKRLIISIFNKLSPLHDGAVIVTEGRLKAARCILPVTERDDVPAKYGLRHRAAIGITEEGDSMAVVVSEETGKVSIVQDGQIEKLVTPGKLRKRLKKFLHIEKKTPHLFFDSNLLRRKKVKDYTEST